MSWSDEYFELVKKNKKKKKEDEEEEEVAPVSLTPALDLVRGEEDSTSWSPRTLDPREVSRFGRVASSVEETVKTSAKDEEEEEEKKGLFDGLFAPLKDGWDQGDITSIILGGADRLVNNDATSWLGTTAMTGLAAFNKGVTATADVLLGKPLQALGWKNNPISSVADYYSDQYDIWAQDRAESEEKLGGGKVLNFAGDMLEGAGAALPDAILAFMTAGASAVPTATKLATQASFAAGNFLSKAGLTATQMAKNPQFWLSYSRTLGSDYEEAKKNGADDVTAALTSTLTAFINSGIEIGIDGGSGIQGLLDDVADGNKSKFLSWVESSLEEGGEEVLQGFVNDAVAKVTFDEDRELLNPKDMLYEFGMGVGVGGLLGGGQMIAQTTANTIQSNQMQKAEDAAKNALTENEQKVVDQVYKDEIAKAEKEKGKKLTKSEKAKLYDEVLEDMTKGYISTDTIESVLGGEEYNTYKQTLDNETKLNEELKTLQDEYNTLGSKTEATLAEQARFNELSQLIRDKKAQVDDENRIGQRDYLKAQLNKNVYEMTKNDRLRESYFETVRSKKKFTVDLNKYEGRARDVMQQVMDSKLVDDTNKSHEFWETMAKIAQDRDISISAVNDQQMIENVRKEHEAQGKQFDASKFQGKRIDGYRGANGDIAINVDSDRALNFIAGHEITHALEKNGHYKNLQKILFNYKKAEYDARYAERADQYAGIYTEENYKDLIDKEVTADMVGDFLFTDQDFVTHLSTENRTVFQKIWDEVKYLAKVVTAGTKEARQLAKVQKAFEDAYREAGKAQGGKYSVSETTDGRYVAVVDNDILSTIDTGKWDKETKNAAKKAASNELKKFSNGFVINGIEYVGNKASRGEYTRSDYSEALARKNPTAYLDKMRAASVLDDVIRVATDWTNDGKLKYDRDDYVDFVRGKTLIMSGDRAYSAIVLAGITEDGKAVFHDVEDVYPDSFEIKKAESSTTVSASESPNSILEDSVAPNVAQDGENVKYSLSEKTDKTYAEITAEQQELYQREMQLRERKETATNDPALLQAMDEVSDMFTEMRELLPKKRSGTATQAEIDRIEELKELRDDRIRKVAELQESLGLNAISQEEAKIREQKEALRVAADAAWAREGAEKENKAINKAGIPAAEYFRKKALKAFKTTTNFNEAGYMLPDGKLLNFSGGERNHRYRDHREIGEIYEATNGVAALNRFLNDGNIRIMAESPGIDLAAGVEPTKEQYAALRKFINTNGVNDGKFFVDFSNADGSRAGNYSYQGRVLADRVINDIKHYYATGEIREQSGIGNFLSISEEGQTHKQYGRWNVKDIRYNAPVSEDVAPVAEEAMFADEQNDLYQMAETPVAPVAEQYEAIRPKPAQKSTEPKMVRADNKVKERKWVGTSTGSEAVDGAVTPEDIPDELRYYQPIPNKKTLGNANAKLNNMGYDASLAYFNSQLASKKVALDDIALGERLIQEAIKKGDTKTASELIQNVAILGTELGQKVQALSIIKKLTPEGQLMMLQKTVDRGKTKGDKAFDGVELTQEMKDQILSAYKEDGSFDQVYLTRMVEDVKQQIADQMTVTAWDKINAWRYLSMLGNPKTHIRNLVSNVAMYGTRQVKNAIARTIEDIAPIDTRTKTWKQASDAVKAFAERSLQEYASDMSGGKYSESGSIKEKRQIFNTKALEWASTKNSDALSAEDAFFSKPAYKSALSEFLTANGIKTQADIKKNPELVAKAKQYAEEQAKEATFQQDSYLASKIGEIERRNALYGMAVGSVLPFKKTPINIAKAGVNYSPLGIARNIYDMVQVKKGNMDASEAIDHVAQTLTGSSLALVGFMLAQSGILNGAGDDDKEGDYDYQLGKQAYSLNFGGDTFSLSWLSPVAMPLFVGANAYEQLVEGKEWNADVVVETLAQTLDPLSEMSFLSSLDSVLSSYDSGMQKFMGIFETAGQNYITQFVPTLSSQIAATFDDTKRSTKVAADSNFKFGDQVLNQIKYKIPGLRNTLEPTTDIWGNEVKQIENGVLRGVENFFAPWSRRDGIASYVDEEIKDLYRQTGDSGVIPAIPGNYINYDDVKYEMTAKEYTQYKEMYGQTAHDMLEDLFDTDTYKNADSETRRDMVNAVYDYARDEARLSFFDGRGVDFTNATEDGEEVYKENAIKGAIEADVPVAEYKFSIEYPEKYSFFKENGLYDTYAAADEEGKRAYTWAYENPGKYTMGKAVIGDFLTFYQYRGELLDLEADKDENGKSISGSKKDKVIDYINNLDLDYGQRIILFRSMYSSKEDRDAYNRDIVDYLESREDISYEEMKTILEELGFKVKANMITWD